MYRVVGSFRLLLCRLDSGDDGHPVEDDDEQEKSHAEQVGKDAQLDIADHAEQSRTFDIESAGHESMYQLNNKLTRVQSQWSQITRDQITQRIDVQ